MSSWQFFRLIFGHYVHSQALKSPVGFFFILWLQYLLWSSCSLLLADDTVRRLEAITAHPAGWQSSAYTHRWPRGGQGLSIDGTTGKHDARSARIPLTPFQMQPFLVITPPLLPFTWIFPCVHWFFYTVRGVTVWDEDIWTQKVPTVSHITTLPSLLSLCEAVWVDAPESSSAQLPEGVYSDLPIQRKEFNSVCLS